MTARADLVLRASSERVTDSRTIRQELKVFVNPPVYVSIGTRPCSDPLEARAVAFRVLKLPLCERTCVIHPGTIIHLLGTGVAHRVEEAWREVEGAWNEKDYKRWIIFRLSRTAA